MKGVLQKKKKKKKKKNNIYFLKKKIKNNFKINFSYVKQDLKYRKIVEIYLTMLLQ